MPAISVSTQLKVSMGVAWSAFTGEKHIEQWNFASADWHCPKAINNLKVGGTFSFTMSARDHSASFQFEGTYSIVVPHQKIVYLMPDKRQVEVLFFQTVNGVSVTQTFDTETENSIELQRAGWQSIMDNFKIYTEALPRPSP